jgi:hypothetical protein
MNYESGEMKQNRGLDNKATKRIKDKNIVAVRTTLEIEL